MNTMALPQLKAVIHEATKSAARNVPKAAAALATSPRLTSFQFLGGLHLAAQRPVIEKHADCLCLTGDIGLSSSCQYQELISEASDKFQRVFLVAGRCEYGTSPDIPSTDVFLEQLSQTFNNVHFLQRSSVMLRPDLIIAGSTLRLRPFDQRYEENILHLSDELCNKRRTDGRKVLYLSYGKPDRYHSRLLRQVVGQRILVAADAETDPPDSIMEI